MNNEQLAMGGLDRKEYLYAAQYVVLTADCRLPKKKC